MRLQINSNPIITTIMKADKRKRPLDDITSRSQQNKRFNSFGNDVQNAVNQLIVKHKLTDSSGQQIVHMRSVELDFKENQVHIGFKNLDFTNYQIRLDAVVRACDEALLGRDGYRHLAAVVPTLFREYLVANRRNKINEIINAQIHIETFNIDQEIHNNQFSINDNINENTDDILTDDCEIGNGAFRSLFKLLKVLIPIWKTGENPIIVPGNTLYIKLGGDGRNVGRKQNHVMLTFCLLNEGEEVLKPSHQFRYALYVYLYNIYFILYFNKINSIIFSICLYIGKEKYETLAKVGKIFALQLANLKNNGIIDHDGIHWPIEFFFSGDWKFTYIIMGLNAPNSEYFCLFCECDIKSRHNMDLSWPPTGNVKGLYNFKIFIIF